MARAQVDHNAIKFGQVTIVLVVAIAWLVDLVWLVPLLAAVLLANVAWPVWGPIRLAYRHVILPLRIVRSNLVADEPAPHRSRRAWAAYSSWLRRPRSTAELRPWAGRWPPSSPCWRR